MKYQLQCAYWYGTRNFKNYIKKYKASFIGGDCHCYTIQFDNLGDLFRFGKEYMRWDIKKAK